jgi:hypothetical protein
MNIRFPIHQEVELVETMKARAKVPWQWRRHDPHGKPAVDGKFYFHRDEAGAEPACTLCILRQDPGNLVVVNIVPDELTQLTIDQYVRILRDFDESIAEPAADAVGGMTIIDTDKRRLEDYFSPQAIRLLQRFCDTSNASDLGSHPSDQKKWMEFLLHVHRNSASHVHCDVFGACLRATDWWPNVEIDRLVREYDFAMGLLRLADGPSDGAA